MGESTKFKSIDIIFSCLNLGLSSPQATDILPYVHKGAFNPKAEPGLGLGCWLFSTTTQSSNPSSNYNLCCIDATYWIGTKCYIIIFTNFNYFTNERFYYYSYYLSCAMNSWISLFC